MFERSRMTNKGSRTARVAMLAVTAAIAAVLVPMPAAAYIDPVSGSVVLQIVSAAVLAGAVTIGRARHWLFTLFRRGGTERSPADE
jgi:hypothetical protein